MEKILHAAKTGNIQILHQTHKENPFLLSTYTLNSSGDNPLTVSIKASQLVFAREILKLNPELALKLDQDGIRPLDVASACGNIEIVRSIMASAGPKCCQLQGKDGRTAIHYAAMNGTTEVVTELLSACSDCAKDVTSFGETAVHLAVKYFKFEVLKIMLEWLEKLDMMEVANWADREGNTVLHYATSKKQFEAVEMLLEWNKKPGNNRLEVNAANKKGLTPTNIVDITLDSSKDIHLREILLLSGGTSASHFRVVTEQPAEIDNAHDSTTDGSPAVKPKKMKDVLKLFEFQWHRNSTNEARGALLVVATLFATVTFEAGIDPPAHVVRGGSTEFLMANTLALFTALSLIDYLTTTLPFQRELRVSFFSLGFAYSSAVQSANEGGWRSLIGLSGAALTPLIMRFRWFFCSWCSSS